MREKNTKNGKLLLNRREALKVLGGATLAAGLGGFGLIGNTLASSNKKVMVLGIDGMDPHLLEMFLKMGKMPNTQRLIEMGGFSPLITSIPPQSPVAWANFITGMNPGGHGIFDFIHREPETFLPYLSTSRTTPSEKTVSIGNWVIPLSSGKVELLRKGRAFWNVLEDHGVDCTVFKIPSNFPPEESKAKTISCMGTPDILGTYGTFSYFTEDPLEQGKDISGGKIFPVSVQGNRVEAALVGPRNAFRNDRPKSEAPFTIWVDSGNPAVKIEVQGHELVLKEGEWSDWVEVRFEMIPHLEQVSGICRFYLKAVRPYFRLYVSPVNINPMDPAMPISTPSDYSRKLARQVGYFYTQGMPEDTKALSNGIFSDSEYLQQAEFVLKERLRLYDYELSRFKDGFFFFYFSSLDLNSHMFWRTMDRHHPLFTPELAKEFGWFIPGIYQQMDEVIGKAMKRMDDQTTLMVMSDHGFVSFRRGFNLNTWLLNNGYASLIDPLSQEETEFFDNVNWQGTRAYGLGINSLYLNIAGREGMGVVAPGEAESLAGELIERLTRVKDPFTGENVIAKAYRPGEAYTGPFIDRAPDIILGYNRRYRASWDTILGEYPREEFVDNDDKWSGDHCMAHFFLPGVFLCSKKFDAAKHPALYDLPPSILGEFGIAKPQNMVGKNVFA